MAKQIEVTRTFNAPVAMVWQLWTDPELVKQWWGPKHYTSPFAEIDFRIGGKALVCMKAPAEMGGQEFFSVWEYIRIEPLKELEFIQFLADGDGHQIDPTAVGMPADFPSAIKVVVKIRSTDVENTEMTVTEYAEFGSISHFAQLGLEQSSEKMLRIFL